MEGEPKDEVDPKQENTQEGKEGGLRTFFRKTFKGRGDSAEIGRGIERAGWERHRKMAFSSIDRRFEAGNITAEEAKQQKQIWLKSNSTDEYLD